MRIACAAESPFGIAGPKGTDPADHRAYAERTSKVVKANIQRFGRSKKG